MILPRQSALVAFETSSLQPPPRLQASICTEADGTLSDF
jgi:hypothetical protein